MKPLRLLVLLVTLPLLLGGCGEKESVAEIKPEEPVAETKPELEGVNDDELEERESIWYLKDSETPYTGKSFTLWKNGQKETESNYKDGKEDGLYLGWYENGKKQFESNYKDGKEDGLVVYWDENGKKEYEGNWKDGKEDGLMVWLNENGQKLVEENFKDGELISRKYWNSKGEPVDSQEEAK